MIRYQRRYWMLAAGLSAIAGFVDSVAFIKLGGFFVSFMSGNSTRLGVDLAGAPGVAYVSASLIASFVSGVMIGSWTAGSNDAKSGSRVMAFVAALLALAALFSNLNLEVLTIGFMAAAMGAENAVFQRDGEVSIGVTYMTGTLVKFGQRLAGALKGGPRLAWLPYLLLWSGLIAGAFSGATAYERLGLNSIWIPAAAAAGLAAVFYKLEKKTA